METLTAFKEYLLNEKRSSDNTVQSYLRDVGQYLEYCAKVSGYNYLDASAADLQHYLDYLSSIGKSEATCTRMLASARCFYKYLTFKGKSKANPAEGIKMQKHIPKLPGVLEANEVMKLLSQPSGNDYKSIRDKAMLEILYATGMKVSELMELELLDVNLQIGIVHIKDTRSERIVPLYPAAVKAVSNYLLNVRPAIVIDESCVRFFTNMNGQPMTRQGFWKIIKHYAETAGIKKDITPHTLRHSFAAHMISNSADIYAVSEMLGHTDVSATQVYAVFSNSRLRDVYTKAHPRG